MSDEPTLRDVFDAELFEVYSYDGETVKLANLSRAEEETATIGIEVSEDDVESLLIEDHSDWVEEGEVVEDG